MIRTLALSVCLACIAASVAGAQGRASLSGTVQDSALIAVANADVTVFPGGQRAKTDSAGKFVITALPAGKFTVRARHMGYAPGEWTVDLSSSGHAELHLVLGAKLSLLDPVIVSADRACSVSNVEGFLCRRGRAKGLFLDYTDIDDMNALYTSDVFRDVEGFTVTVMPTRNGPVRVPVAKHCINTLIDGLPSGWNSVPKEPYDIAAIEIYQSPKDIPREFARYTWGKESCWLVAYWTVSSARPLARAKLPYRQAR